MVPLIDMGLGIIETLLGKFKTNLPAEVVSAIQAAYDALMAHKNDLITQAALEAERG
jgi:hypothetical protein